MKTISHQLTLLGLALATALCLTASPVGSISGTVKDSTGAVVPGVTLTLVNTDTNAQLSLTTNAAGEYQFLSMSKTFPLWKERLRMQFRGDFFNIFNHANFSNPVSSQSSASFDKITSTVATAVGTTAGLVGGGPRVIQFSLRLSF